MDEESETPAPAGVVVDKAAEDTAEHGAGAVADVAHALDDAPVPQRDEVGAEEGADGHQASAADAGDDTAEDHDLSATREAADQVTRGEENVAEDQARAAAEDVRQPARDGLARRVRDQVGRRQPWQEAQGLELARYRRREGRDDARVDGA